MTGTRPATVALPAGHAAGKPLSVHPVALGATAQRTIAIVRHWRDEGAVPAQMAILARVNSALLPVQVALEQAGIARTAPLDPSVLGRTGIRTALAYLRIGLDPDRIAREDVLDTLNRPSRRVKSAVQPFLRRSRHWSLDRLADLAGLLDGVQAERFAGYLDDLQPLVAAVTAGDDTAACLALVRHRVGLGEAMDALDSSRTRPEGSSHGDDLDALEQLAVLHAEPTTFRDWLVASLRVPGDPTGVTLSTVHRVKGMEWDRVVVFAVNAGLFPHRLADDVEEERRVFHVAVTRCRTHAAVVGNRDTLSPFVAQLSQPAPSHSAVGRDPPVTSPSPVVTPAATADGRVVAEAGLEVVVTGGFRGAVQRLDGEVAVVALPGGMRLRVPLGEPVTVDGRVTSLAAPARSGRAASLAGSATPDIRARAAASAGLADDALDGADLELFEQLRGWRARTAAAAGMPAYVVLHDSHLRGIARRRPANVRELAACPGIGPTKLDRYADDLLAVVNA